ncbi:hypothetical protein M9H77_16759 [Catharanthus roseus]|uniref:Uncharacterized protein n=1 Tax=Catharanthus roseus TaxID=4058 RepID=A0ACC0B2Q6_CATRO|nr:hypothetical protein M9H77_16759 [Catharanthus roseus]
MMAIEEAMKEGLKFKNVGLEDDGNPPKLLMVQCLNMKPKGLIMAIEETMKEGLKFKTEGLEVDGNPPKLLMVQCLNLKQLIDKIGRERNEGKARTEHITGVKPNTYSCCYKSHKRAKHEGINFILSTDAQLPTPHNEGTSESPHSNLDQINIIMQELQFVIREMREMRGDITNLSIEQRGQSHIKWHVNSHTQRGYGNYNHHGLFGTLVQSTHQFYDGGRHTTPRGGRRGDLGERGSNRPQEEVPRHEA